MTSQRIIEAHERAGDEAARYHLHADAAQWYHRALSLEGIAILDRRRVAEKLKKAYFLSENPNAAAPLADWLAKSYLTSTGGSEKAVEALIDVATQLFVASKTEEALPKLVQAAKIAEAAGLRRSRIIADLQRVRFLHILERNDEAQSILAAIAEPGSSDGRSLRCSYYREKGHAATILGQRDAMRRNFERALAVSKEGPEVHVLTYIWSNYAHAAQHLGDIDHAKTCLESAILVAREHQVLWRISSLYIYYADVLAKMGRYIAARDYLSEAVAYSTRVPESELLLAGIGIPIALKLNDAELLARCEQPTMIFTSFQDGNPTNIGYIAAAFANLYVLRGNRRKAQLLLRRAMRYVHQPWDNWYFLLGVAQHGSRQDISKARVVLEQALKCPNHDVAAACLSFFDALVANRAGHADKLRTHATEASRRFEALHWFGFAEAAGALIGHRSYSTAEREVESRTLTMVEAALTLRERQVADFVLRGLTNREIAAELRISENTVEKHMSAIMGRLGVRSRHQLADILRTD